MIIPKCLLSVMRIVTAVITAVILLIVSVDEKDLPSPDGAEICGRYRYALLNYDVSSQGVTNDGTYFYFSGNKHLGKADMETGEIFLINTNAIPEELQEKGCNHIGGLSYYNGYTFTWQNGRELATSKKNDIVTTYKYGADGLRIQKTVGSTVYNYYYSDGLLVRQTWGSNYIDFLYDESGLAYSFIHNGTQYF